MLLPFTFMAIKFLWDLLTKKKIFKILIIIALTAVAALQILNGVKKAIKRKYDYEYKVGRWLKAQKYDSSNPRIIVATTQPQYPFWADGVWMNISDNKIQFTEQLEEIKQADFVVLEDDQQEIIKIIKQEQSFKLLEQKHPQVIVFARGK